MRSLIRPGAARSSGGASLVELLITVLIMSVASVSIFGLLTSTLKVSKGLNNRCDSIDVVHNSIMKMGRDVREARSFGDVFGELVGDPGDEVIAGTDFFPSNLNPLYGAGQTPPRGWPTWADNSAPAVYTLDNRTLIVQIPVFDINGWPVAIPPNTGNPPDPDAQENVETHVYRVVRDPNPAHPGEFILQVAYIPGMAVNGAVDWNEPARPPYNPLVIQRSANAQTLATGIIGPLDASGLPRVFQYLRKGNPNPQDGIDPADDVARYTGVLVTMEISQHKDTSQVVIGGKKQYKDAGVLAIKSEFFLRNNTQATTIGAPTDMGDPDDDDES